MKAGPTTTGETIAAEP